MKYMKKIYKPSSAKFVTIFVMFVAVLFIPFLTIYAQTGPGPGPVALQNPLNNITSFSQLISNILDIVVKIGVPIAALAIIYSGFLFVTAQGNEEKLSTAKKALIWSVAGTAILLGASVLANAIDATITSLKS
jgi:hypothetical protein